MNKTLLLLLSLFFCNSLLAQDQHFTQFYASPLSMNPALSGAFNGKFRLSLIYRDQWRNVLDNPYVTYAGTIDLRFPLRGRSGRSKDAVGVGMAFYNDKVSSIDFVTNQIMISGAFHKSLSSSGDQFLSLGVQAGITQRSVNYENLTFEDQFNGSNEFSGTTGEIFPENNFSFGDYNVGLHYSYAPAQSVGVFAGLAIHHVLEPQISFYFNADDPERGNDNKLFTKITGHLSFQIPLGQSVQMLPRALFYKQGPHLAINAGTNFRFLVDDVKGTAIHLGSWARPVSNENDQLSIDAIVGMVGIEYSNFLVGLSYDANLNDLNVTKLGQGAFEISIAYLGEYDNGTVHCPSF